MQKRSAAMREMRICKKHGMIEHTWHRDAQYAKGGRFDCMECKRESTRKLYGNRPMTENRNCSSWLGIHIAERALSKFFKHIVRTPSQSSGGDFRCDRNYLIDVKCACLHFRKGKSPRWFMGIKHNTNADHFLFLLFDDRTNLTPMHVMLVPGSVVNNRSSISITNTPRGLERWSQYEKPLNKVICCCEQMRAEGSV
jgi:hypothetical protein